MDNFLFRLKIRAKVFFVYLFYFPGLILHEGSHAVAAILTMSKITQINLFPSIDFAPDNSAYRVTYGYVRSIAMYRAAYMLIGLAPFALWAIPFFIGKHLGWIDSNLWIIHWKELLSFNNWWFFLLLSQIIWAGFPSSQDWRVFFEGLLSISAIVVFVLFYFTYTLLIPTISGIKIF